jgi:hypothetical protein
MSRGSILHPAWFHFQPINVINPIWPDTQLCDTYLFVVTAFLVVWFNRKTMFSREGAVTEVIPRVENREISKEQGNVTGKAY